MKSWSIWPPTVPATGPFPKGRKELIHAAMELHPYCKLNWDRKAEIAKHRCFRSKILSLMQYFNVTSHKALMLLVCVIQFESTVNDSVGAHLLWCLSLFVLQGSAWSCCWTSPVSQLSNKLGLIRLSRGFLGVWNKRFIWVHDKRTRSCIKP